MRKDYQFTEDSSRKRQICEPPNIGKKDLRVKPNVMHPVTYPASVQVPE
jgi:hypothetical protein